MTMPTGNELATLGYLTNGVAAIQAAKASAESAVAGLASLAAPTIQGVFQEYLDASAASLAKLELLLASQNDSANQT